ncbi:hypothetical protein [Streptomyces mirabilis]|uniref:hypothetical protein n=1 Tax=Streptomyces mirabilis TaxID=68239 RepID=UPI0036E88662
MEDDLRVRPAVGGGRDRQHRPIWNDASHAAPVGTLPPDLILDATGQEASNATYKAAKQQRAVFVAVERLGLRWRVNTDALTAPQHAIDSTVYDAVRTTVIHLIRSREVRPDSSTGPVYFVLYDIPSVGGMAPAPPGETQERVCRLNFPHARTWFVRHSPMHGGDRPMM